MKKNPKLFAIALTLLFLPTLIFAQIAPNLGVSSTFVLFSSSGAVSNVGISKITGNVGTNSGACTGFGNVNGQMHIGDGTSASAAFDLNLVYNDLSNQAATNFPGVALGGGQVLTAGVFFVPAVSTLSGILTLNGLGDPNACFIFQLTGAFNVAPGAKIVLANGTKACNVFWKIDGATSMSAGSSFIGTIVCNGAIELGSGDILEGRALSVVGAITVTSVKASTPIGCGSPVLTGPLAPAIGSTACYALLTSDGALTNTGISMINGDIGTNNGPLSGFDPLLVAGMIHSVPDASTAMASADLNVLYTYLNTLSCDIELLYPAQFGNSQVLTPHVYCLNSFTHLTDTIFLDARGNANAIFAIKINGALTTSTYSNVVLQNGTTPGNVFWLVNGAVDISDYSNFKGTIVANNGAITLFSGTTIDGKAFSTVGAITTHAVTILNAPCGVITVSGQVSYDNAVHTPMTNTTVLLKQNNVVIASTTTNINGNYQFSGVQPGTYQIGATTTKLWGGSNATDALLVLQHFVGTHTLTGLALLAANVNGIMGINSTDALMIAKRYTGLINTFPVGDWVFDQKTITVGTSNVINNFTALCFGDVNRSYLPPAVKTAATIELNTIGKTNLQQSSNINQSVTTTGFLNIAALSMIFNYPQDILEVTGISIGDQQLGETMYNAQNGELRISWYNLKELQLLPGSELLNIHFRTTNFSGKNDINIKLDGSSEASDLQGNIIQGIMLSMPALTMNSNNISVQVFPNPACNDANIVYAIPVDGTVDVRIYNMIGNEVAVLVNNQFQSAGTYKYSINAVKLPNGVYSYKLNLKNKEVKSHSGTFIISH